MEKPMVAILLPSGRPKWIPHTQWTLWITSYDMLSCWISVSYESTCEETKETCVRFSGYRFTSRSSATRLSCWEPTVICAPDSKQCQQKVSHCVAGSFTEDCSCWTVLMTPTQRECSCVWAWDSKLYTVELLHFSISILYYVTVNNLLLVNSSLIPSVPYQCSATSLGVSYRCRRYH